MARTGDHRIRPVRRRAGWIVALPALLWLALPAGADWLITLEGRMIETAGPWTIQGRTLTYVDLEGEEHTLDLDEVDLEASEETTALKAGRPYVPADAGEAAPEAAEKDRREKPKVILYLTSLCQECVRVQELLEDLGVDFVVKDINRGPKTYREYKKKAGHGGGVPVVDIDGALVFSANPRVIRQRVREMREREAAAAEESPAPEEEGSEEGRRL